MVIKFGHFYAYRKGSIHEKRAGGGAAGGGTAVGGREVWVELGTWRKREAAVVRLLV